MTENPPATRGRKIFNGFALFVLFCFLLFCLAMAVGVASIPSLRERANSHDGR
jgi:hypothetical protein